MYFTKLDLFTKLDICRKFLKSVQGQGPTPSLTFTHHSTNRDLWIAGAYGDDPGVVQKILENIKDYVESSSYKAGMLY